MAGKTYIDGTAYDITGGKTMIGGTAYDIKKGKTYIGATAYDINFKTYSLVNQGSYGWTKGSVTNPDSSLYDGVYQSTNKGVNSSYSVVKITFSGYTTFTVYIRSYAEGNYDYTIASTIDASSYPTAYNTSGTVQAHTRGNQKSGTALSNYTQVNYTNDGKTHFIYIVFRKDSSQHSNDDLGYFLIKK